LPNVVPLIPWTRLEEIRRLFARYRQPARHGQVTDRDEPNADRRDWRDSVANPQQRTSSHRRKGNPDSCRRMMP
jgi:hypothetical protein